MNPSDKPPASPVKIFRLTKSLLLSLSLFCATQQCLKHVTRIGFALTTFSVIDYLQERFRHECASSTPRHSNTHTCLFLQVYIIRMNHKHTMLNPMQPHAPGLLASGPKSPLESHKIFNDSQCRRRRCYLKRPRTQRGSTAAWVKNSEPGAALESLDGAGPGLMLKLQKWKHRQRALAQLYDQNSL